MLLLLLACASDPTATDTAPGDSASAAPTWHQDIAPLVTRSCVGCHVTGGVAPFPLDTYELASAQAQAIAAAVESGSMPPWDAVVDQGCAPTHGWKDDLSLTAEDKALLRAWADGGAPEGDAASATTLPDPPDVALDGANQRLTPDVAFVAGGTSDQFGCVSLDPGLTADRWLTGLQVDPDDDRVVHHVLVFTDPNGESAAWGDTWQECFSAPTFSGMQLVGAWAPGAPPFEPPATSAVAITAGTRLVMQVHYHPAGLEGESDRTAIDLRWSDEAPEWDAMLALLGNAGSAREGLLSGPDDADPDSPEFLIPAGAAGHTETIQYDLSRRTGEFRIFAAGTHMHYLGTGMEIRWRRPQEDHGPTDECLVETAWDFNWQRTYAYDAAIEDLPVGKGGDSLWMQCTYDNTLDNPGVQRALDDAGLSEPIDVRLGETTLDEMCLGVFGILTPHE